MKLGTEASKPEGIISLLYLLWLKSIYSFSKHQKGEGRKILVVYFCMFSYDTYFVLTFTSNNRLECYASENYSCTVGL